MSSAPRVCRKCGADIFADAPEGLCTGCVLETALGMLPGAVAAVADCGLITLATRMIAVPARAIYVLVNFISIF